MERILQEINGVACYLDDILVTGLSDEEHLKTLEHVLQKLEEQLEKPSSHHHADPILSKVASCDDSLSG